MALTILHLPDEILVNIFEIISFEDFLRRSDKSNYRHVKNVCTRFQRLYKCVKSWVCTGWDDIHAELEGVRHVKRLSIALDGVTDIYSVEALPHIAKQHPELEHLILLDQRPWRERMECIMCTNICNYICAFPNLKALECESFGLIVQFTSASHLPKLEYLQGELCSDVNLLFKLLEAAPNLKAIIFPNFTSIFECPGESKLIEMLEKYGHRLRRVEFTKYMLTLGLLKALEKKWPHLMGMRERGILARMRSAEQQEMEYDDY